MSRPAPAPERKSAASAPAPTPSRGRASAREAGEQALQSLVARLSDEVRRGHVPRAACPRSRGLLLAALALALAGAGALVTYEAMHRDAARAVAPAETLPAGTERILPADLGATGAGTPAIDGTGSAAPQSGGAGAPAGSRDIAPPAAGEAGSETPGTSEVPPQISEVAPRTAEVAPRSGSAEKMPPAAPPARRDIEARANLRYQVHVASFKGESKVRDLVRRLRARGLDAWYAKATDQKNWYRVFIGHYATHEEAARQAASLLDKGMVEHAIAYPDHAR